MRDPLLENLAQRFVYHGEHIYGHASANSSPLYAALCPHIAADEAVLALVSEADRAQQVSNLLFGAVHYLLLSQPDQPLCQFYASLTATPAPPEQAYPAFRDFCLHQADLIRALVNTRRVQTNEVQRCTGLLPAFARVDSQKPLACVEIGASAGLNLHWPDYFYDYGAAGTYGDPNASVQLTCEVRQGQLPALRSMTVGYNIGIDLNPIRVQDDDAMRWLRALIWPEQHARAHTFEQAVAAVRQKPVTMIAGSAVEVLPAVLAEVPPDFTLCVFHSYTFNQMPAEIRAATLNLLHDHAQQRDFYRVSLEWYGNQPQPALELFTYHGGEVSQELLASCESHGRWIEWVA